MAVVPPPYVPRFANLPPATMIGAASMFPRAAAPTLASVGAQAAGMAPAATGPVSAFPQVVAPAAGGLMGTLRGAMGLPAAEGAGLRASAAGILPRVGRGVGIGLAGAVGGGMLDESNLLGGSESALNDSASKAIKWGAAGAGIGSIFPGIGTVAGGLTGAAIGLGQEFLERQGVLKAPTVQETIDTTIQTADQKARELGVPEQVINALKQNYRAQAAFAEPGDKAGRTTLAQSYADTLEQEAIAFASDPNAYLGETTQQQGIANMDPARQFAMQAMLVNAIKPYADQYQAQSEATAQSLENMAASAGDLAPMYQQYAAQQRQMGTMYAGNLIQSAQISPYQQAAEQQAAYLKQISNQTMSSAIGQVMSPQQGAAAGSTDLTAIIEANANAMQPQ